MHAKIAVEVEQKQLGTVYKIFAHYRGQWTQLIKSCMDMGEIDSFLVEIRAC